jgi:hypothetical protein
MTTGYHIKKLLQLRSSCRCKVKGCIHPKLKHHISYCRRHRNARQIWGDPEALAIKIKDYQHLIPTVKRFFKEHPDSDGLQLIRKYFREMLPKARKLHIGATRRDFPWLTNALITSQNIQEKTDALIHRLVALMLYDREASCFKNPEHMKRMFAKTVIEFGRLPLNDGRHWKTGRTRKMAQTKQGRLLQALGSEIWNTTKRFWIAAMIAIEKERKLKELWTKTLEKVT